MRKIIPFLLMITIINAQAQQPVSLSLNGKVPAKSIVQSDFIAVHAADSFTIAPNLQFNRPPNHLLKGAAKALGTGAITWQLSNRVATPAKENGKRVSALPAIGVGMAVGLPDLVKGFRKNSQPALLYTFYTKDHVLIESKKVYLKKKGATPVKGIVPADGFMVVTLVNGRDIKMVSGDVVVNVKKKEQYKGGIVKNRNLQTMGDCLPDVIVCEPPSETRTEWDEGLTHYILICRTEYTPNNEEMECEASTDCWTESFERSDYIEYSYIDSYVEGCYECNQEINVWASGNVTHGTPFCELTVECGGDPDPDPDPGGGGSDDGIINTVTDPCIKFPINNIITPATPNSTADMLNNIFGPGKAFNLTFKQTINTVRDGTGETNFGATDHDIEILLTRLVLDGAAQEFTTAAILHEIYHAYLLTQPNCPTDQIGQHEIMLHDFTDDIANTLKSIYPNMTDDVAVSLALGGYGDVQSSNAALWDSELSFWGLSNSIVSHVNTYYKTGLEGTRCQ